MTTVPDKFKGCDHDPQECTCPNCGECAKCGCDCEKANQETIGDVINRLAKTNKSTKRDALVIQYVLRKAGFPNAIVVSGIVYLEGRGTLQAPPTSIHGMARVLKKTYERKKVKLNDKAKEV